MLSMKKRSGVMPVVVALAGVSLSWTSLFLAVNTGLIAVSSLVMWNVSHFVAVTVLLMIISTRDQLVHCGHHCCFDMVHHGIAYHSSCHWCFSVEDYGNSHWSSLNGTWNSLACTKELTPIFVLLKGMWFCENPKLLLISLSCPIHRQVWNV